MKHKIGVITQFAREQDPRELFSEIAALGLNCCQLGVRAWMNSDAGLAEEIRSAADEFGVEITAVWAGWSGPAEWNFTAGPATLGLVPPAYRDSRMKEVLAGAEFGAKMGVSDVITHVGFMPENADDPNYNGVICALRYIASTLRSRGQYFLFETGQETPVVLLRAIEDIGTGNVGVNLDTANLILYGKANPVDALDVFGRYVRNTHCKDGFYPTDGKHLGREVAIGEGKVDFAGVVKGLKALGYDGPWIIEREISGEQQKKDILRARDYLASLLDA